MKILYEKIKKLYEEVDTEFGDVDDIKLTGDTEKDFETLINLLRKSSYSDLVDDLKDITDDPKLYALLKNGFGEGKLADVHMSSSAVDLPVTQLLPSQNEIGLPNSLKFALKSDDVSIYYNSPVMIKAPIITYRKTFIVDGHHRWSQIYMMNPQAKVKAINFNYTESSPYRILRNFQGAIAVANKDIIVNHGSVENVYAMSESEIQKYIENNITDGCVNSMVKLGKAKDKDSAIEFILGNVMTLKADNPPFASAPDRDLMPQTDDKSIQVAMKGQTNI